MKLLHIDSSVLGDNSASRALTAAIVAKETELHPGLEVTYLDLAAAPPLHLSPAHIGAMFGHPPTDQAVLDDIAATAPFIDQVFASDIIVIGAPMYNFAIPSQLKSWIDRIVIAGKTFKYTETGAVGLVPSDKKVIIASARGGIYSEGPFAAADHQETYLRAVLGFIGLTDITFIRAEGLALPGMKEGSIAAAKSQAAALT